MFESLSQRLQATFDRLSNGGKLTENDVNTAMRDVRMALLEADVALPVVKDFVNRIKERAIGADITKSLKPGQQVVKIVHEELITTLGEPGRLNFSGSTKPYVIMLIGLQGSGKTTTAAKLAVYLRREGRQPFMIAADTYRPAAVDQLITLSKQIGVPYYEEGTRASPPDIVSRGLKAAKDANAAVCIIDTAGRLQIDDRLMEELEEIKRRANPAEILLVADAMTGQEAVNIAQGFNQRVGITGLILTKIDGDARGGAAISMRAVTNVPIKFLGTGEKIDGFEVFHPDRLADRILGMGDIMTLIEKAEAAYDEAEAEKLQKKLMENQFTLQDFLEQLQKIRRMGPISQIMNMIPGMSQLQMQNQMDQETVEKRIKRVEAIINSMTRTERNNPKILNASRKKRIASGSGVEVRDVNDLLKQFRQMQDMMGQIRKGRFPKIPGLPPNLFG
ncbi:MAG: signal recognition particle protein [Anaerolineae bacterium]|jgi:signal recognition particle subunit SRP54|nr:signal recognition particle protein [Anaerolineae bacterium]